MRKMDSTFQPYRRKQTIGLAAFVVIIFYFLDDRSNPQNNCHN